MTEINVHYLLGVEGGRLLIVFYSARRCYQFRIVTPTGEVMGDEKIYYTADAALTEGRRWLGVSGANGTR